MWIKANILPEIRISKLIIWAACGENYRYSPNIGTGFFSKEYGWFIHGKHEGDAKVFYWQEYPEIPEDVRFPWFKEDEELETADADEEFEEYVTASGCRARRHIRNNETN